MQLSDVTETDLEIVLALNEASVPHVNSVDLDMMRWFAAHAYYFRVAKLEDKIAGFLIGLRPGTEYASENYRWFCANYTDFAYVDRIVVARSAHRLGVASRLYDEFADRLRGKVKFMTCEVNIRPPNEISMQFHESHGFVMVGTQETGGGEKEVALLERKL